MRKESSLENIFALCQNPVHGIARGLRERGYEIAGHGGIRVKENKNPATSVVGVLEETEPIQKSFLGFMKYNEKQRARLIGELWLNNAPRYGDYDEKWIFKPYGKEYAVKITKIIKKICAPYKVKLEIEPPTDSPREEVYLHELL